MFDKKTYVKEKILTRLNASLYYQQSTQKQQINDLMDSLLDTSPKYLPNLDMVAFSGATFEESTIGWLSFCKAVNLLLEQQKEVSLETLKEALGVNTGVKETKRSENVTYDYTKIDEDPETKLKRLSEIAEEADIAEDIEYDFLTDEGLKLIGAVERNDTSLDAEDVNVKQEKLLPIVRVEYADLVNNVITSPFTGTTQVAQVTSDVWMDIDTEQMFRVKVSKSSGESALVNH